MNLQINVPAFCGVSAKIGKYTQVFLGRIKILADVHKPHNFDYTLCLMTPKLLT